MRYHELSWIGDIDEEERLQALYVNSFTGTLRSGEQRYVTEIL